MNRVVNSDVVYWFYTAVFYLRYHRSFCMLSCILTTKSNDFYINLWWS